MPRHKKVLTFWEELIRNGTNKCLIQLSKEKLPFNTSTFPQYHVYPSKLSDYNFTCDIAHKLGKTTENKAVIANLFVDTFSTVWVNMPFKILVKDGFLHFKLPEGQNL
jgi:hypothetical protein